LDLPVGFTTRLNIESPSEALRFNQDRQEKLETIDAKTVNNKYLSNIRAFFRWAHDNAYTATPLGADVRVSVKTGAYDDDELRVPFTNDQLETIFAAPLFQGCASPSRVFKPGPHLDDSWRFWGVLIGLYTGARSHEIGQLIRADLIEQDGVPHFWIRRQLTEEERQARVRKRLKTASAHRLVPVHPELVRLGLLRWLEQQSGDATDRLFPDWEPDKNGSFSDKMTKFFCQRFLPNIGVKTRQLAFHSLRHTMNDALRQVQLAEDARSRVLGHATRGTNARYGKSASLVGAEIEKFRAVTFDCPALARIQPRA
jgi:integrase